MVSVSTLVSSMVSSLVSTLVASMVSTLVTSVVSSHLVVILSLVLFSALLHLSHLVPEDPEHDSHLLEIVALVLDLGVLVVPAAGSA
jgi:hypothetical protein